MAIVASLLRTPIGRLRLVGLVEGVSYLLLLLVAMPLKYLADMPLPVKVIGSAHGALFVLYCVLLLHAMLASRWSIVRASILFIAAFIPLGTFVTDARLKREDAAGHPPPGTCSPCP